VDRLKGGDLRSIGRSEQVVKRVLRNPLLFQGLFNGILSEDKVVRARCADAVEKVTRVHPKYLQRFKRQLLDKVAGITQQEVRWHVAQMLPRLKLTSSERAATVPLSVSWIEGPDKSRS
jgi:hypothetical protein